MKSMRRMMVSLLVFFIGHAGYGVEVADSFRQPLDVVGNLTQDFSSWNETWQGYHLGEDIVVSKEEPVRAVANGEVKFVGTVSGYGYVVITEHKLPDESFVCFLYGHLREDDLTQKKLVIKGEVIGYLSDDAQENGGYSFVHIHQGVRKGKYVQGSLYYSKNDTSAWRWWWAYLGYTKNVYLTQKTTGQWDVTHQSMLNDWYDPTDFINAHQSTQTSYTYSGHAYTGSGALQGGEDTGWRYSLPQRTTSFALGETAKAIVRAEITLISSCVCVSVKTEEN